MFKNVYKGYYPSPIGILKFTFTSKKILSINFVEMQNSYRSKNSGTNGTCYAEKEVRNTYNLIYDQLNEYFTGKRKQFDLPVIYEGTNFQVKVWECLKEISYGQVKTYQEVAEEIGKPSAVRAIGQANKKNPLAIIIPCHRVIASSGDLSGYNGGKNRKRWLLKHEKKYTESENFEKSSLMLNLINK